MNTSELRAAILSELRCRTRHMYIASLVEDYGPEVKRTLVDMRRAGDVRLIESSLIALAAEEYGCSPSELRSMSVEGGGSGHYIYVEVA